MTALYWIGQIAGGLLFVAVAVSLWYVGRILVAMTIVSFFKTIAGIHD